MRAWGVCAVPGPGPGGGRRVAPDLPLQLTWLVFTPGSCPRFFHFLKPQTRSTFIIKTHRTRKLRAALQPGVGGCWPGPSSATRGSGQPPVGPCRSLRPASSSEDRASISRHFPLSRGEGPRQPQGQARALWVHGAAVRSLLGPGAPGAKIKRRGPRSRHQQDEKRQWLHAATPKLRPHRGSPAPREPEC